MSGIRTGNFFIDSELDLRTLQLPTDQYRQMRRKSILFALTWLENNVLSRDDVGHHLREKIQEGVKFDDRTHRYLTNSCLHWQSIVTKKDRSDDQFISFQRPYSSAPQPIKSSPNIVVRPMTCPGKEVKRSRLGETRQIPEIYPRISSAQMQSRGSKCQLKPVIKPSQPKRNYPSYEISPPIEERTYKSSPISTFVPSISPIKPMIIPETGVYRQDSSQSERSKPPKSSLYGRSKHRGSQRSRNSRRSSSSSKVDYDVKQNDNPYNPGWAGHPGRRRWRKY